MYSCCKLSFGQKILDAFAGTTGKLIVGIALVIGITAIVNGLIVAATYHRVFDLREYL